MLNQTTLVEVNKAVARGFVPPSPKDTRARLGQSAHAIRDLPNVVDQCASPEARTFWGSEQLAVDIREVVRLILVKLPHERPRHMSRDEFQAVLTAAETQHLDALAAEVSAAYQSAAADRDTRAAFVETAAIRRAKAAAALLEQLAPFNAAFTAFAAEIDDPILTRAVNEAVERVTRAARAA